MRGRVRETQREREREKDREALDGKNILQSPVYIYKKYYGIISLNFIHIIAHRTYKL